MHQNRTLDPDLIPIFSTAIPLSIIIMQQEIRKRSVSDGDDV